MKKLVTLLGVLVLCVPAQSRDSKAVRQLADRTAIEEVMQKYVWSVDALDADGYVSVFTLPGTLLKEEFSRPPSRAGRQMACCRRGWSVRFGSPAAPSARRLR